MDEFDILIIGAGVVGLAIARELSSSDRSILLVEKNDSFGRETSSRNSEVIHAGMYYPEGTLKAELCVEGGKVLYETCRKKGIPHKKTGKLIVAVNKDEIVSLEKLLQQGKNNGVEGLSMLTKDRAADMEPNIECVAALYSHETGIIDSHRLMEYFLEDAKANGAAVVFNAEVISMEKGLQGYKVSLKNDNEDIALKTRSVINCAGLDSDEIAQMPGIDIKSSKYELHYCKGQYFRVSPKKSALVKRLVYPSPVSNGGGLGIHATLDLAGALRLGPDDEYLKIRNKDYSVDNNRLKVFFESAKKFMPFLSEADLMPDIAGIRPKLQEEGGAFRDFVIQEESAKGYPCLINLIGIESPGLTASAAIAMRVREMVENGRG